MDEFLPKSPDPRILTQADQTLAKFGHLNFILRDNGFLSWLPVLLTTAPPPDNTNLAIYTITAPTIISLDSVKGHGTLLILNSNLSIGNLTVTTLSTSRVIEPGAFTIAYNFNSHWYLAV